MKTCIFLVAIFPRYVRSVGHIPFSYKNGYVWTGRKSQRHLISPYSIIPEPNISVMRIKGMISKC